MASGCLTTGQRPAKTLPKPHLLEESVLMTMYALGCLDLHGQLTVHSSLCSVCQALSWCWSHVGSHQHGCAPGALIALGVPGKGCGEESFSSRESGKSQGPRRCCLSWAWPQHSTRLEVRQRSGLAATHALQAKENAPRLSL